MSKDYKKEPTPFQAAKRRKEPYVKLVIDTRHLKRKGAGRVEAEGGVSEKVLRDAKQLLRKIAEDWK